VFNEMEAVLAEPEQAGNTKALPERTTGPVRIARFEC
jgi:hypothetical protein